MPTERTTERAAGDQVQDCFAVFWIWMAQLSKEFTDRGRKTTSKQMHDKMCCKFLGCENGHLITLTHPDRQSKESMCVLLSQIEKWAAAHGIYLKTRRMSEYAKYKQAQE